MAKSKEVKVTKMSRIAVVEKENGLGPKNIIQQGARIVLNNTIDNKVDSVKKALLNKSSLKQEELAQKEYDALKKFVSAKTEDEQIRLFQDIVGIQSEIASLELTTKAFEDTAANLLAEIDYTEAEE